jgi:hypothetical protein
MTSYYHEPVLLNEVLDCLRPARGQTFADGTLTVNIPEGSYRNGCNYCLVIAQTIPEATTIAAPVVITIGDGTETYPVTRCSGAPVLAAALRVRTKYPLIVATTQTGGTFRLIKNLCCAPAVPVLDALTGDAPAGGGA